MTVQDKLAAATAALGEAVNEIPIRTDSPQAQTHTVDAQRQILQAIDAIRHAGAYLADLDAFDNPPPPPPEDE